MFGHARTFFFRAELFSIRDVGRSLPLRGSGVWTFYSVICPRSSAAVAKTHVSLRGVCSHRNVRLFFFAAERRKNIAPGVSPGFVSVSNPAPEGAKESTRNLSPLRGWPRVDTDTPGLAPGAAFLCRSAAETTS